jgi:hypothetical protein
MRSLPLLARPTRLYKKKHKNHETPTNINGPFEEMKLFL